jgi:hypothetical protein
MNMRSHFEFDTFSARYPTYWKYIFHATNRVMSLSKDELVSRLEDRPPQRDH